MACPDSPPVELGGPRGQDRPNVNWERYRGIKNLTIAVFCFIYLRENTSPMRDCIRRGRLRAKARTKSQKFKTRSQRPWSTQTNGHGHLYEPEEFSSNRPKQMVWSKPLKAQGIILRTWKRFIRCHQQMPAPRDDRAAAKTNRHAHPYEPK
jgi:hypothetical protein